MNARQAALRLAGKPVDELWDDQFAQRAIEAAYLECPPFNVIPFYPQRAAPAGASPARSAALAHLPPSRRAPRLFLPAFFDALGWIAFSLAILALIRVLAHLAERIGGAA